MIYIPKRKKKMKELFNKDKAYSLAEAIQILLEKYGSQCKAKFDETVEVALHTLIDEKRKEVGKGSVILPHGSGKKVRIGAFVEGDDVNIALSNGAEIMTIESVKKGEVNFDVCIATPDIMPKIASLARILGPRGLMPNPKLGTVTKNIAAIIAELQGGRVDFKGDKYGNINLRAGKLSFAATKLHENIVTILQAVKSSKPVSVKGTFIASASISSTMGIGVKIALEGLN